MQGNIFARLRFETSTELFFSFETIIPITKSASEHRSSAAGSTKKNVFKEIEHLNCVIYSYNENHNVFQT